LHVLRTVGPAPDHGCDQAGVVRALKRLGVEAVYRGRLGLRRLRWYTDRGLPVIVTLWPEWCEWDHWTPISTGGKNLTNPPPQE
jgi:hypothetical protein